MATEAFNLAEQLQTPIFVLSDLDLGMNNWMSDPFPYPEKPFQRGKVLSADDLNRLGGFARYKDVDKDGIPYRTLPGTEHPAAAYFTRGSGHNEKALYSERPDDYQNNMERLNRKFETSRSYLPRPEIVANVGAKIGVIAYGSSDFAVRESRDQLKNEYRLAIDYVRIRAFPFSREVHDFIDKHERVYVVEQNRDGQMLSLLKLDIKPSHISRLCSVRHFNGLPIDARSVTDDIISQEGK
jgi:2-oxoglutarate ferredoxin oxidoreductase subunit alpha